MGCESWVLTSIEAVGRGVSKVGGACTHVIDALGHVESGDVVLGGVRSSFNLCMFRVQANGPWGVYTIQGPMQRTLRNT